MLQVGQPNAPIRVADLIARAVRRSRGRAQLFAGFAYANLAGISALRDASGGFDWCSATEGRWLVGIDGGITQPSAVEQLSEISGQEVRLFLPSRRLTPQALTSSPKFHAKFLYLQSGRPPRPIFVWVGSANATSAAIGPHSQNFEAAFSVTQSNRISWPDARDFHDWWNDAWKLGVPATASLLDRYSVLRGVFLRHNPGILRTIEAPSASDLKAASSIWFEAGAMSGEMRNQIEFNRELAGFFGHPSPHKRLIEVQYDGHVYPTRPLTPKKTSYGVRIWRLGLPTRVDYAGKIVHLVRLPGSSVSTPRFRLDVDEVEGRKAAAWEIRSNRSGYVGATTGAGGKDPRRYGIYY